MSDYVKQAVLGTQDYHAVMRQAAVAGMQRLAGYKVQECAIDECSIPELIFAEVLSQAAMDDSYWHKLGNLVYIIVEARMCIDCRYQLSRAYDTIYFRYHGEPYIHCEICGRLDNSTDDIPF